VRWGSYVLGTASGSGDQLCNPTCPALEVAFHCVCLLGFPHWRVISLLCPVSLGQVQCSVSPLHCPCVMTLYCLFFSFVGQFGFGCRLLAQELCDPLPALLWGVAVFSLPAFLCLFTDSSVLRPAFAPSISPVHFQHFLPSAVVLDYSSLFVIQF
jgi:hypothetical protein